MLLQVIGELLGGVIPRYKSLARSGQIELTFTPGEHPIVPLLLDMNAATDAELDTLLPAHENYPGGEARAQWHVQRGIDSFRHHFDLQPQGCWPAEGGVSEATLKLLAKNGFSWAASGQSVLHNSVARSAIPAETCEHQPFVIDTADNMVCFFRDDKLSDLIGFDYCKWQTKDAVKDLIQHLENIDQTCATESNRVVSIPNSDGSVLYRVEAAKPTATGSSLQAYCRNRDKERFFEDFNHEKIVAPIYNDGGVIGSKIAIFGCPVEKTLETIGQIEITEGLPHPMIDGEWAKTAPNASASYLITSFTEDNVDEAIELTKKAGLKYLYHYGKTFENWGQFDLYKGEFPNGIEGLKKCVEKAEAAGIKLGTHVLSNFITTNDPYVTPIPDKRLAKVGSSIITNDIDATQTEILIESPEFFNQMKNNSLKTVVINNELIRYGSVSKEAPWRLLDCQRGAFETKVSTHKSGEKISKLLDHAYKVFLTNTDLTIEMSKNIANLYNQTGLRQISFDGLEGNRSTGLGTYGESLMPYVWYNSLSDDLKNHLIIDASRTTHFFWHIYTRMNWGEPWYAGFRESQTEYRMKNQPYFKRNFMPGMLGWFKMAPETSIEDVEWLLTRSAAHNAGFAFIAGDEAVQKNGNKNKILQLIGDWEKIRLKGLFTADQIEIMKDVDTEYTLVTSNENEFDLHRVNSGKFTHNKKVRQPGEPLYSTFNFNHSGEEQTINFIINAVDCDISNITMEMDNYKEIELPVSLKAGEIVKYTGGTKAYVYDVNWNLISEFDMIPSDLKVSSGDHSITFDCKFNNSGKEAKAKLEVRTFAPAEKIAMSK